MVERERVCRKCRLFVKGHECPQCGAPVDLEETDRLSRIAAREYVEKMDF